MEGLKYQLKSISKDKMAILSFFLPIVMAVLINLLSASSLNEAADMHFVIIKNNLPIQMREQLEMYGDVAICNDTQEFEKLIMNPADETIGVIYNEQIQEVKAILSGDETSKIKVTAKYLPSLLEIKSSNFKVITLSKDNTIMQFKNLLIGLVMITALFIGCTFNTMNIVSEKEDGIVNINEILPMSAGKYVIQKIFLGFICSILVSIITAIICFNLTWNNALVTIPLIVAASFMASILGLYISKASDNLIMAIVYIKITLVLFIAVPFIAHLFVDENSLKLLFHFIPSYSVFDGLMKIIDGHTMAAIKNIFIIILHCIVWYNVYLLLDKRKRYKKVGI